MLVFNVHHGHFIVYDGQRRLPGNSVRQSALMMPWDAVICSVPSG